MKRLHNNRNGFTLIEMLVALAVVAISLAAISSNYVRYFDVSHHLKENTLARWIAENHLALRQSEKSWPPLGTRSGQLLYANLNWRWQERIVASPDADFRKIEIEVQLDGKQAASASLAAYIANPNPAKRGTP